jgi:hypothetical protein
MMESPAFLALSLAGRRILDRLEIQMAHHGGNDNGRLPVTFDQFVEYGIHRHSIATGLREVRALVASARAPEFDWNDDDAALIESPPPTPIYRGVAGNVVIPQEPRFVTMRNGRG